MLGSWIVGETTGSNVANEEGGQDRGGKRPSYTGTADQTAEQRVCLNPMSSPTRKTPILQLLSPTQGAWKKRPVLEGIIGRENEVYKVLRKG